MFEDIKQLYKVPEIKYGTNKKTSIKVPTDLSAVERNRIYQKEYRRLYKQELTEEQYAKKLENNRIYFHKYQEKNLERLKEYHICPICSKQYQLYNKSQHKKLSIISDV